MNATDEKRKTIAEVSQELDVPVHLLRQWEARFPQLRPKRTATRRRTYSTKDIDIAKRIKYLLQHDKLGTEAARRQLAEEIHGHGRPRTNKEALELIDKIETEARAMLDQLDAL